MDLVYFGFKKVFSRCLFTINAEFRVYRREDLIARNVTVYLGHIPTAKNNISSSYKYLDLPKLQQ